MSPKAKANSLLIRDIHTLVTMAEHGSQTRATPALLHGAFVYAEAGEIKKVGTRLPTGLRAAKTIRAPYAVVVPGLINTHHHLFQTLTRACTAAANAELFDWLTTLYPRWARIDEEAVHTAALVGMAELMLSGCTTTTDHHYLFPRGQKKLIDAEIEAARRLGMRFHPTRGSMNVGVSLGGLPPDSVVQTTDEILEDSERVIRKYHDTSPGSMLRIALAPCSPFTVDAELMRQTAALARRHGVRMHTHLAETRDEEEYCLKRFRRRPLEFFRDCGWLHQDTWVAHGIYFNSAECRQLGRAGIGVAHCPTSNMRLASGICPVGKLQRSGSPVGLGVDGSASNDSSNMLAEARQALLLNRLARGASAITVEQALRMATMEGARCLGRDDIGSIAVGKRADLAVFDLRDVGYSGAEDALSALLLCAPTRVSALVIEGRVVVENGDLQGISLVPLVARHRRIAAKIVGHPPLL
ncbi:MAG TPA: 8-oxoguanine deaminase [Terriglobales bacterium]|nr:8-oxoguanine deaminase [Terriglobales bacterium]